MKQYSLEQLDEWVRAGQFSEARQVLSAVNYGKVPRKDLQVLANLAYRIHDPSLSLRILGPIIRGTHFSQEPPTDLEFSEYAIALCRLGATKEARYWLELTSDKKHPKVLLYQAFIRITEWNYQESIPFLEEYICSSNITEYQKLVGQTNLAAAYLFVEDWKKATPLLKSLRKKTSAESNQLLHANALELSSQLLFLTGFYREALEMIELGSKVAPGSSAQFFLKKWKALIEFHIDPADETGVLQILQEAQSTGAWESVRECHFHMAQKKGDSELFFRVYFGTPNIFYKRKLLQNYEHSVVLPKEFVLNLEGDAGVYSVVDLVRGTVDGDSIVKAGSLVHKALQVLSQDLYKPARLGSLFSILYPKEHFNPNSTPDRVHQLIRRLRLSLKATPLEVLESGGMYSLRAQTTLGLRIANQQILQDTSQIRLQQLKTYFENRPFSVKEVRQLLQVSRTQVYNILNQATENGGLSRSGQGPATRYQFDSQAAA